MPGSRIRRDCPICGEAERKVIHGNPMAHIDDCDLGYDVVRCSRCAFCYADSLAPARVYQHYYSRYSKYDTIASADDIPLLSRQMAMNAAAFLKPHLPSDATILDIGCSIGLLLDMLRRIGYGRVSGLDPGPNSAVTAQRLFGVPVSTGFLEDISDLSSYDVLIFSAVMEHLADFRSELKAATEVLKDGALIYVEVPAADRFSQLRNAEPFGEFSLEHVNFFGSVSLGNFARSLGLKTIEQRHVLYVNGAWGLMMLFRKTPGANRHATIRDVALCRSMEAYVEYSDKRMQEVNDRLRPFAGRQVIVYGAGSHTARLLRQSELPACNILFVADRNPNLHGVTMDGLQVCNPADLAAHPEVPVVVSSYQFESEIAVHLSRTLPNPIILLYGQAGASGESGAPFMHA